MERVLDVLMDIPDQRVKKVISLDSKPYMYTMQGKPELAYKTVLRHIHRTVRDISVILFMERV